MIAAEGNFFRLNPALKERFAKLKGQNRNYLAHEYFNDAWELFYHSQVAEDFATAKLTYLGSAALLEQVDVINLSAEQIEIMNGIEDPVLKETVRDFLTNQQFRRDVFIKGAVPLGVRSLQELWLERRFVLLQGRAETDLKVTGARGEATLKPEFYEPILDALANGPRTLREMLASHPAILSLGWAQLIQALTVLVGGAKIDPCLPAREDSKRVARARAFNAAVCKRAENSADLQYLASPVTGGGFTVGRFQQLFLQSIRQGKKSPEEWARTAWEALAAQNQRLIKDGATLETAQDNLAELTLQAREFGDKRLPVLKALQIA